jgi:hypothetical protein
MDPPAERTGSKFAPLVAMRLPMPQALVLRSTFVVSNLLIPLVRAGRLELPRPYGQQILSLPRLPFRHARSSCSGSAFIFGRPKMS